MKRFTTYTLALAFLCLSLLSPAQGELLQHRRKAFRTVADPGTNPGTANLVSWWTLNESSGSTRNDSHSTANHLSDNGTVNSTTGKVGNAADFSSDYLSRNSPTGLPGTTSSWSFSCWLKPTSYADYRTFFSSGNTAAGAKMYLLQEGTTGELWRWDAYDSNTTLTTGVWTFVVFTFASGGTNTGTELYYVNGTVVTGRTGAVPAPDNAALRIGASASVSFHYLGAIDEAALWNKTLSQDEITWLYNSGNGRTYSDL